MRNKIISVFILGFSFITFQDTSNTDTIDTSAGATVSSSSYILDANASASVEGTYIDGTTGASVGYYDDDDWDDEHDDWDDDDSFWDWFHDDDEHEEDDD